MPGKDCVLGFTGTRNGMTAQQKNTVTEIVKMKNPIFVVHGDCEGADTDFRAGSFGLEAQRNSFLGLDLQYKNIGWTGSAGLRQIR